MKKQENINLEKNGQWKESQVWPECTPMISKDPEHYQLQVVINSSADVSNIMDQMRGGPTRSYNVFTTIAPYWI